MCDRHGTQGLTQLTKATLDRRSFLKASALGTIAMGGIGRDDGPARFGSRRFDRQRNSRQRLLQRRVLHHARASTRQGGRADARIRQYAVLRRSGHLPRHRTSRRLRAALHQLHGSLRRRRAGEDRRRRRRPGRLHRRPARPRHAGQAQGQDARHLPERHARSAAVRLAEEARRLLQGRDRPLHGFDGRNGGRVQGRRARHRLDDRALRLGAAQRRERLGPVVRRRRHLWPAIHRLRARGEHRAAQEGPQQRQGADQGDAEGAAAVGAGSREDCSRSSSAPTTRPRSRTPASAARRSRRRSTRERRRTSS